MINLYKITVKGQIIIINKKKFSKNPFTTIFFLLLCVTVDLRDRTKIEFFGNVMAQKKLFFHTYEIIEHCVIVTLKLHYQLDQKL